MSILTEIEYKIDLLEAGSFQALCDDLLYCKGYRSPVHHGRSAGNKTTVGVPDTYFYMDMDEKYVFVEYTTQKQGLFGKIKSDLEDCFNIKKTHIESALISSIIYCHTSSNLKPSDDKELRDYCKSQGVRLEILGVNTLAQEIQYSFQWLAKNHLEVNIGDPAITDYDGFLEYYSKNTAGPTLATIFCLRENEIEALNKALDEKRVIIVQGKPGVGKTKLTLEVCKSYAEAYNKTLYCIRSYQGLSYTDISKVISAKKDIILLLDDANQLSGLFQLLELVKLKPDVQLVLTVRDYAIVKIRQEMTKVFSIDDIKNKTAILSINPFDNNQIKKIAQTSFEIYHPLFLDQIAAIAKGNARLGVMACELVLKNENALSSITNASQLYDDYYSNVIETVFNDDKRLLKIAGLMAFLSPFDLDEAEYLNPLFSKLELDSGKLRDGMHKLHEHEIADVINDRAIKFSDQSLQTYLIKRAFFDAKMIGLDDVLQYAFPKRSEAILRSLNSVNQIFGSEEIFDVFQEAVARAWLFFSQNGEDEYKQFVKMFGPIRPTETLLMVKRAIEKMKIGKIELNTVINKKLDENNISDYYIEVLCAFRSTTYSSLAFEFLIRYFFIRPDLYVEVGSAIALYGVQTADFYNDFATQQKVVDIMTKQLSKEAPQAYLLLYIHMAEYFLRVSFKETRQEGITITFQHGQIPITEGTRTYRSILWNTLIELYKRGVFCDEILKIINNYGYGSWDSEKGEGIVTFDLDHIKIFYSECFNSDDLSHLLSAEHLDHLAENMKNVEMPFEIKKFLRSPKYSLYRVIAKDELSLDETYEDKEKREVQEWEVFASEVSENTIQQIFTLCSEAERAIGNGAWCLQSNLNVFLCALAKVNPRRFIDTVRNYIQFGTPLQIDSKEIIYHMISLLGSEEAYREIISQDFTLKYRWMANFFAVLPENMINDWSTGLLEALIASIYTSEGKGDHGFSPWIVLRYKVINPEIFIDFCERMLDVYIRSGASLGTSLENMFNHYSIKPEDLHNEFNGHELLLTKMYLEVVRSKKHCDYDGRFLKLFLDKGMLSLKEYLDIIPENWRLRSDDQYMNRLAFIWMHSSYVEYADSLFEWYFTFNHIHFFSNYFFIVVDDKAKEIHQTWLDHCVHKYHANRDMSRSLFDIIVELPLNNRKPLILLFTKLNPSYEAFENIRLVPNHYNGVNGSFVPAYEKHIDELQQIKAELSGLDYIEHANRIESKIERLKVNIRHEEVRNFLSEFN